MTPPPQNAKATVTSAVAKRYPTMHCVVALSVLGFVSLMPQTSQAFNPTGWAWPNGEFEFYVNENSFTQLDNVSGLSLPANEYGWWVAYAASRWVEDTNADIEISRLGTTNASCAKVANGTNVIGVWNGCAASGCNLWAVAITSQVTGDATDSDICVYEGAATWQVQGDLAAGHKDLIGVLVHEIGHSLGLDHTAGTVMDSPTHNNGNTNSRHPYGDDIAGLESIYGSRTSNPTIRTYTPSTLSVGSPYSLPIGSDMPVSAALGRNASGSWRIFVATVGSGGAAVNLAHTVYPLAATPTWTTAGFGNDTDHPVAVAATDSGASYTVLASVESFDTLLNCNGLDLFYSQNAFAGGSSYITSVTSICTNQGVALAYDPTSDRFVMAYLGLAADGSGDEADTNRVYLRSGTHSAFPAATELDTGRYSLGRPSIACSPSDDCVVSFADNADNTPNLINISFSVNPTTGAITLGSAFTDTNFASETIVSRSSGAFPFSWFLRWTSSSTARAANDTQTYVATDTTPPVNVSSWTYLAGFTRRGIAVASNPGRANQYLVEVD
jgi:hypothetical protein